MTDLDTQIKRSENKSVAAVVVTYNRKDLLMECLQALLNLDYDNLKILVVDNASTDGTRESVAKLIEDGRADNLIYINTGENLGGAGGFNVGVKEAMMLGCDYIWLMDDDCIVHNDSLDALLAFADSKNNKFGFLSSVVRWTDGEISSMNVQRKSISRSVVDFELPNQKIKFASFVSLFLNREAVERCGLPIKEFFIWGDDWEYTSRISKQFDNYLVTDSVVTHKSANNVSSDIVSDSVDRTERYFYAYRNEKFLFVRLGLKGKIYFFIKVLYHKIRLLLSDSKHKKQKMAVINKGLKAAKTFKPQIEFAKDKPRLSGKEIKWNILWNKYADGLLEYRYFVLCNYYAGVNGGGHSCFLDNNAPNLTEYAQALKSLLPNDFFEKFSKACDAYIHNDDVEKICDLADDYFYKNEQIIIDILQDYANGLNDISL